VGLCLGMGWLLCLPCGKAGGCGVVGGERVVVGFFVKGREWSKEWRDAEGINFV
jgi:hypothetical protein